MSTTFVRAGAQALQQDLLERFHQVRKKTTELASRLSAEDQMVQSMCDASPTKWHMAHTTWFFETFIVLPNVPGYSATDPRFTFLFNSYYKQLEDGHPLRSTRGAFSRPSLEEVMEYRRKVDSAMDSLLGATNSSDVIERVELGINHEQQHQELIVTDIKHAFWTNPLRPTYAEGSEPELRESGELRWIEFDGGLIEIGHEGSSFSFDNELPRHKQYLRPFKMANRLVTNTEYMEFMLEGAYKRPELWLSDAWDYICANALSAPLYWERRDGQWMVFTTSGMKQVVPEEPVCHVSLYEADAFARWAGARLASEAEWEIAAGTVGNPVGANLLDSGRLHPSIAHGGPGLQQIYGDVWEWTSSAYSAYPGYRPAKGVLGEYNGKFMCNQVVLRGGSCATPASHIRASYRNFFPPHARWQFMGIRLANDRD